MQRENGALGRLLAFVRGRKPARNSEETTRESTYTKLDFLDGEVVDDVYWRSGECLVRKDAVGDWVEIDSSGKHAYDTYCTCGSCGRNTAVWRFNPRLGDASIFHCDSCHNQIHVSWNLDEELTREVWPEPGAKAAALEHIRTHLGPCRCGGTFQSGLEPFCPFCHARLDADLVRHFGVISPTESFLDYWVSNR